MIKFELVLATSCLLVVLMTGVGAVTAARFGHRTVKQVAVHLLMHAILWHCVATGVENAIELQFVLCTVSVYLLARCGERNIDSSVK